MALQVYSYQKDKGNGEGQEFRNGVQFMLHTGDDGDTAAVRKAAAMTVLATALGGTWPTDYFDTEQLVGPPTAGVMTDEGDAIIITPHNIVKVGVA